MIVITAPTGNIGHQVLSHLLEAGAPARVIVCDASKLPELVRDRVEVVEGSHGDAGIVERAFPGADTLFWLVPPNPKARTVDAAYVDFTRPAAAALQRHGVKRVVDITALGRGTPWADRAGLVASSFRMDDLIASTGAAFRAVTNPSFMDNIARQAVPIREKGLFFLPFDGDKKMSAAATRDIAGVGPGLAMSQCSGRRICLSTTWPPSWPRYLASQSATSGFRSRPTKRASSSAACRMRWRRA
jgi:uncharacterized protein YbjT (DUF2867 family)